MLKVLVKQRSHRHIRYRGRTRSEQTNHPHQPTQLMVNPPSKTAASRFCSLCFMWEVIRSRHQRSPCRRWLQQWRKWCQQPLPDQRQYYPCGSSSVARTREKTLNQEESIPNIQEERTNTHFTVTTFISFGFRIFINPRLLFSPIFGNFHWYWNHQELVCRVV